MGSPWQQLKRFMASQTCDLCPIQQHDVFCFPLTQATYVYSTFDTTLLATTLATISSREEWTSPANTQSRSFQV